MRKPTKPAGDESKLAELILYISQKCASDPAYGATKLNKILYFSDFISYGRTRKAITGVEYQRLPNGPAPKKLVPVRNRLIRKGELAVQPVVRYGLVQKRLVNLREPDLSQFSADEIATVDSIIEALAGSNAKECSEYSHEFSVGWAALENGEVIPYNTALISNEPLSEAEIIRGREIAEKLSLSA